MFEPIHPEPLYYGLVVNKNTNYYGDYGFILNKMYRHNSDPKNYFQLRGNYCKFHQIVYAGRLVDNGMIFIPREDKKEEFLKSLREGKVCYPIIQALRRKYGFGGIKRSLFGSDAEFNQILAKLIELDNFQQFIYLNSLKIKLGIPLETRKF
jgi:hypothetical protein